MPSLFQCRLLASPHAGRALAFTFDTCFHAPMGPAHTSGGFEKECRINAADIPSRVRERRSLPVVMDSAPIHSLSMEPPANVSTLIPLSPRTLSVNSRCPASRHAIQLGEDLMPGVRLRASPPAAGTW